MDILQYFIIVEHHPESSMPSISTAVQHNCHIADARHAGDYSLCIYLMKMREYYRWEKGFDFNVSLSKNELANWLQQRESLWDELEPAAYAPIPIDGDLMDPFDTAKINSRILKYGLVYSGGLGISSKPHFFLGQLINHERRFGYDIYITDKEFARDLSAYPAMSLGNTIFIRRDSIRRMVWEKIEEWQWNQPNNAMKRALAGYDYENDLNHALNAMTEDVMELTILHEIGEVMAGEQLGPSWNDMLANLQRSKLEFILRAVRDHLADSLHTMPVLLKSNSKSESILHFYFAMLSGIRKTLAPTMLMAYKKWVDTHDLDQLKNWAEHSPQHWHKIAASILTYHESAGGKLDLKTVESIVEQHSK